MFGFFIGFLSLVGLIKVLRWGSSSRYGFCGHHGHHGHRGRRRRRGRRYGGRWMEAAFDRLDTSPEQETEIRSALEELMDEAHNFKRHAGQMKDATEAAFGPSLFDEGPLDEVFAKQDDQIIRMRVAVKHALQRVHEALDEGQRKQLTRWLSRFGPRFPAPDFGPYR